jgi:hypothetical protein
MTTIVHDVGGDLLAVNIESVGGVFTGDGSGLTNVSADTLTLAGLSKAVVTDGTGLVVTVDQISATLGGTGVDSSAYTGVAKVASGVWSASGLLVADIDATAKATAGTADTIAIRDNTGGLTATALTAPLLTQTSGTGNYKLLVGNVATTNATPAALVAVTIPNNYGALCTVDVVGNEDTGALATFTFQTRVRANGSGALTTSNFNITRSRDAAINTSNFSVVPTANTLTINAVGVASKNIKWICSAKVLDQAV